MLNKINSNILQHANDLLRKREYEEALAKLGEIDFKSISPDNKILYYLIHIECNLFLSNYSITNALNSLLGIVNKSNNDERIAKAKHLQGWLLSSLGNHFDARESLFESYILYKKCDYIMGQARVLNRLAFACFHLNDQNATTKYLQRCLTIYNGLKDEKRWQIVSSNLASLYYWSGSFSKAIEIYNQLTPDISTWGRINVCIYIIQSAMPIAMRGDFDKAKKTIIEAITYSNSNSREQANYYEHLGWINLLEGDYTKADKTLNKGLDLSLKIAPESTLISQIKRRLADVHIGLGSYGTAIQYADEALAVAKKINERVEIAACHRALAQCHQHLGKSNKARPLFKEAIDLFSMIGSRYELAVTQYLAAISGLYPEGQRQAFLYLAREYFESEKVTPYLTMIDAEVNSAPKKVTFSVRPSGQAPEIVTRSRIMHRLTALSRNIAASEMSVLLTGPTGTGKDLFARYIHHHSERTGRFVSVNTAAIPEGMIEAELFGHRKGAFTGADRSKMGLIEDADQGTLYLNEIADSSPEFQAKLLDVLENRSVRRLGETRGRKVAFRLIAATNRNLEKYVQAGHFRPDLYHRLNDIHINLPPLRDRLEDIPDLLSHFLKHLDIEIKNVDGSFDQLAAALTSQDWTGNIRQFKSEVERLAFLSKGNIDRMVTTVSQFRFSERDELIDLLNRNNWNRREVARVLGLSEGGVRYRIKKYKLTEQILA